MSSDCHEIQSYIDYNNAFFFDAPHYLLQPQEKTPQIPTRIALSATKEAQLAQTKRTWIHRPLRRRTCETDSELQPSADSRLERHTLLYRFPYPGIRPKIWKYLLKYVLINDAEQILLKKQA